MISRLTSARNTSVTKLIINTFEAIDSLAWLSGTLDSARRLPKARNSWFGHRDFLRRKPPLHLALLKYDAA
jgi:hypothetical protein